ncbi:hypothetical protein, partial [Treponema sp.]|uniref:hypothetical protein n=1 Tax=Treponema sp. TaxID=166 RepID=UPI00388DF00F
SKILNLPTISSLLSDNQYTCFLNYYLENIFDQIMTFNGIIESYYTDFSIVSIFSPALFSENHCELALNTAFSIKDTDKKINADIKTIPLSPKIDGMNDDLYTAFFILNHNKVKVSTQTALFTDSINTGFTGAKEKFSFKICDNSWKEALSLCDFSQKTGLTGIIVNEKAGENLKNSCIIRKLNENYEVLGKLSDDNEKLWNYTKYWNQAMDLLEKGDKQKALAIFKKLNEGRPNDNAARYFIKLLEVVE